MRIVRLEDEPHFVPEFREYTPEELKEAYRLARESFTAADLQKYTELDEGVPFDEFIAELEVLQKEYDDRARKQQ